MSRLLVAWVLLFCASAQAQDTPDPMKSVACKAARQQLDEALSAGGPRDKLSAAQRRAAAACLGRAPGSPPEGRRDEPTTGRFVPPPVAVAPIPLPASPAVPEIATSPSPAPPVAVPRPPVITACDAAGCWDSEGRRHNRQGPVWVGPDGVCTPQSGHLNCP